MRANAPVSSDVTRDRLFQNGINIISSRYSVPKKFLESLPEGNIRGIALAKILSDCLSHEENFSTNGKKTNNDEHWKLLNEIVHLTRFPIPEQNHSKKRIALWNENFVNLDLSPLTPDQINRVSLAGWNSACAVAKKNTQSASSQKTIEEFKKAIEQKASSNAFDLKSSIKNNLSSTFDPSLSKLQKELWVFCELGSSQSGSRKITREEIVTNYETALFEGNAITNRLQKMSDSLRDHFIKVQNQGFYGFGKNKIQKLSQQIQLNIQKPEETIKTLREFQRDENNFNAFTRRFSRASINISDIIDSILEPFLVAPHLNDEDLKKFVNVFAEIPYSNQYWEVAFKKLCHEYYKLDESLKSIVLGTALKRQDKYKKQNPNISALLLKSSTNTLKPLQEEALSPLKKETSIEVNFNKTGPSSNREINFQIDLPQADFLSQNSEKMGEAIELISEKIASQYEELTGEKIKAETLEERIRALENFMRETNKTFNRPLCKYLVKQGHLALELEKKRKEVSKNNDFKIFYNTLLRDLTVSLSAARAISSGIVGRRHQKSHIAGMVISSVGEILSLPVISGLAKKIGAGIQFFGEYCVGEDSNVLSHLTNTNQEMELFAEKLTLALLDKLRDKLKFYKPKSIEKIAHYCKEKFETLFIEHSEKHEIKNEKANMDATIQKYVNLILLNPEPELFDRIYGFFSKDLEPKDGLSALEKREIPKKIPELLRSAVTAVNKSEAIKDNKGKEEEDDSVTYNSAPKPMEGVVNDLSGAFSQLKDLKKVVHTHEVHITSLTDSLAKANRENKELKNLLEEQRQTANNILETLQHLGEKNKQLETLIRQQETTIAQLTTKITELEKENVELKLAINKQAKQELKDKNETTQDPFSTPKRKNSSPQPFSPLVQSFITESGKNPDEVTLEELSHQKDELKMRRRLLTAQFTYSTDKCAQLSPSSSSEDISSQDSQSSESEDPKEESSNQPQQMHKDLESQKLESYQKLKEFLSSEKVFCSNLSKVVGAYKKNKEKLDTLLPKSKIELQKSFEILEKSQRNLFESISEHFQFDAALHKVKEIFLSDEFAVRRGHHQAIMEKVEHLRQILDRDGIRDIFKVDMETQLLPSEHISAIFQRYPRYEILFRDLQKSCEQEHPGKYINLLGKLISQAQAYNNSNQENLPKNPSQNALNDLKTKIRTSAIGQFFTRKNSIAEIAEDLIIERTDNPTLSEK